MHNRLTVVFVAGLFALSGCTTSGPTPRPDPDPSTRSDCDPAASEITWEPKSEGEDAPLGFQVHTLEASGTVTTEDRVIDYEPRASRDGSYLSGDETAWVDELVDDFARTGQAGGDLTPPPPSFDNVEWEPEGPGVWVAGYWTTQVAVPFSVVCDGGDAWSGQLEISEGNENGTVLVQCGYTPPNPVEFTDDALAQCPPT